jgi:hypothetical protein
LAQYNKAKKEAAKKKEKFDGQKPVKVEPKQVGGTFKTKEEAEKECEKRRGEQKDGNGGKKTAA